MFGTRPSLEDRSERRSRRNDAARCRRGLRTQIVARDDHPAPEDAREFRFEVLSHFAGIEADRRLFVEFKRDDAALGV
jgi:hypothetical protein